MGSEILITSRWDSTSNGGTRCFNVGFERICVKQGNYALKNKETGMATRLWGRK
jgi:hypothetical protein